MDTPLPHDSVTANWLWRLLATLLFAQAATAVLGAGDSFDAERQLLHAAILLPVAVALFPLHYNPAGPVWVIHLLWSCFCSLSILTGSATLPEQWPLLFATALLIALFTLLLQALAIRLGDRRRASHLVLGLLALGLLCPLWLAPMTARFAHAEWLVNSVIAASPASYLASMAGTDYLRSDWFYRYTPYGGLRYDYPDPLYFTVGICLLIVTLCALARTGKRAQRVRSIDPCSPETAP
jgi:hypothetical protein